MPIVTTSNTSSRRPRGKSQVTLLIAAVAIIAAVAVYLGTRAFSPRQVPDTTVKSPAAPTGGAASGRAVQERGETPHLPQNATGASLPEADGQTVQPSNSQTDSAEPAAAPAARPKTVESPVKPKPKVFDNPVENELEELSRANGLGLRTPQVNMTHEETLEYLRKPVEIYDDDDPATVAAKERTAAMKTEALAYIEKGGTLNQFMRDYQAQAREDEATLEEVRNEMKRLLNDKGREAAQAYLDEVNPQLKEAGLPEVRLSGLLVKAVERRKQREAEEAAEAAAGGGGLR